MTATGSWSAVGSVVVIGVGNAFRRDDGVGEAVVDVLRDRLGDGDRVRLVPLDGEPARMVEAWDGAALAVVVDAVRAGGEPGAVHRLEVVPGRAPVDWPGASPQASTHGAGVAEAVALGAVLDRLPHRLVVLGVEGVDFGEGPGMSAPVDAAVEAVADAVLAEITAEVGADPGVERISGPGGRVIPALRNARRVRVEGVVQGVGYRPFVWRLAEAHGVTGWVRNRDGSVEILAEGAGSDLDRFCHRLASDAPPLARVDRVDVVSVAPQGAGRFEVEESIGARDREGGASLSDGARRLVAPDAATCPACLAELRDPHARRHRYPFVNCTDCGPRFTIIDDLPYDRSRTSMAPFPLCPACASEYTDPADRRYHAEPVACPDCGPRLTLVAADGRPQAGDPIAGAAAVLRHGGIVALKGLGGYQLACDATDEAAVAELRRRKHRPDKPFAVMVADLDAAATVAELDEGEARLLSSAAAPIVLVADRSRLAPSVAPGHRRLGLLLPTTPLHHLLMAEIGRPLVMTSGNRSDEPIACTVAEARRCLGGIADAFLHHDRRIAARFDDSVASVRRGEPALLRRARGYAPHPVALPARVAPTLAVGAEWQVAFCLARGGDAFVSAHVGDLDDSAAITAFEESVAHLRRVLRIDPAVVAHDLHPDLHTTRFAERLAAELGIPRVAVQHHHAHVASVMAEHGLTGPVIGIALDGFGLGLDGTGWGGELLVCDWGRCERVGHLRAVAQPGGDLAVRHPLRMALALARDAGCLDAAVDLLGLVPSRPDPLLGGASVRTVEAQIAGRLVAPMTSSAGRLLDAVAALTGVCRLATYEGQPAMLLEQAALSAPPAGSRSYPVALVDEDGAVVVDTRPLVAAVVADLAAGVPAAEVAAATHRWLGAAMVTGVEEIAARTGIADVCLAGGVWANDLLLDAVSDALERRHLRVHVARQVPPGDGGLALGQVLVAHARGSA